MATPDGMGFREPHIVRVDGKGRHLGNGSLNVQNGFVLFERGRERLNGVDICGDGTWGEGRQGGGESPGRGRIRGKGKASRRVETEANGVF